MKAEQWKAVTGVDAMKSQPPPIKHLLLAQREAERPHQNMMRKLIWAERWKELHGHYPDSMTCRKKST